MDVCPQGSEVDEHIKLVLTSLTTYYECFAYDTYVLTASVQRSLDASVWSLLRHYNWLNNWATAAGWKRWHQAPKFHFLAHVALHSVYQNPRYNWNYTEEDFMGVVKHIAEMCTFGTPVEKVASVVCEKWALGVQMRFAHSV